MEREYLKYPVEYNIWRAPTDNDRKIRLEWERAGYHRAQVRTYETRVIRNAPKEMEIITQLSVSAVHIQRILDIKTRWKVDVQGQIKVDMDVKKNEEFPFLPRFGLRFFFYRDLERVRYCGMGPDESYPDKHQASWHGIFEGDVRTMHRPYLKPQEYGSHWDCSWCELLGKKLAVRIHSETPFMFQASSYTQEELSAKAHNFELQEADSTILCLDYKQSGIGSGSCGPQLSEQYQLNDSDFSCNWTIKLGK